MRGIKKAVDNVISGYTASITSFFEKASGMGGNSKSSDNECFKQLVGIAETQSKTLNYIMNGNLALLDVLGFDSSSDVISDGTYKLKKSSPLMNTLNGGLSAISMLLTDIRDHLTGAKKFTGPGADAKVTDIGKFDFNIDAGKNPKSFMEMVKSLKSFKKLIESMGNQAFVKLSEIAGQSISKFVDLISKSAEKMKNLNKTFKSFAGNYLKVMGGLAAGLLALVGSLILAKFIDWSSAGLLIGFVAGLMGVLVLMNKKKLGIGMSSKGSGGPLLSFALGISILLLAVNAIPEVDWTQAWKIILFITAISVALSIGSLIGKISAGPFKGDGGNNQGLLSFAFGIGILLLAVLAISEIGNMEWAASLKLILFITTISLAVATGQLIGKGKSVGLGSGDGMKGVLGFAIGVGILLLSIVAAGEISKDQWMAGWMLVGFISVISLTLAISAKISGAKGDKPSWQAISIAGSISIVATSMIILDNIKNPDDLWKSALIMTGVFVLFAITSAIVGKFMSNPLAMIGVGVVSGVILISSVSMKILGNTPAEGLLAKASIMTGTFILFSGMAAGLAFVAPLILIGAGSMAILGGSMIVAAHAMKKIGDVQIDKPKIKEFTKSLGILVVGVKDIGLIKSARASATSLAILPVLYSSLKFAKLMKSIADVKFNVEDTKEFVSALSSFINIFDKEVASSAKTVKSMGPNLSSITSIVDTAKGFITIIETLAAGKIAEYDVDKSGKIFVKSLRDIDIEKDVPKASEFIGKMIGGLLQPMLEIGSNKPEWVFGNIRIENVYKKKSFSKGEERMKLLGNAYTPLLDSMVKILGKSEKMVDEKTMISINNSIGLFIDSMISTLDKIDKAPQADLAKIGIFAGFMNTLSKINWQTTVVESAKFSKNIGTAVKNINGLKLQNAVALNRTLELFSKMKLESRTKESVDKLILLIDKMNKYQENVTEQTEQVVTNTAGIKDRIEKSNKLTEEQSKSSLTVGQYNEGINNIQLAINDITTALSNLGVTVKNSSPILVKIKEN
jgi:hypothetical protein